MARAPGASVLRFPLLVDDHNNYQHRYSHKMLMTEKIREIESQLAAGDATPGLVKQRSDMLAELESYRDLDHPSRVIASLNSVYAEKDRLLYARIESASGTPCFYLQQRPQQLIDDIVASLKWEDPTAKNLPYSQLCAYPMTEPDKICIGFIDLEEEFLEPFKDAVDPSLDKIPAEEREDEARQRRLGKPSKYSGAKQANLEALRARERAFAMRCRWVPILVRCSILSLYCYDISDAAVYTYSGCTNSKNSMHMHLWVVPCKSTTQWNDIMENAYNILHSLPDTHECKKALRRTELCQRGEKKKEFIIDFGINNPHRQFRCAFQRKRPDVDNAFVPYSIAAGSRVTLSMANHHTLREWIKPTVLGMAMPRASEPFVFGHEELVLMRDELWNYVENELQKEQHEHDPTRMLVSQSINALLVLFGKHVKPTSVGGTAVYNEIKAKLKALFEYLKAARHLINTRLVFGETARRETEKGRFKHCCYRSFVCLLVTSTITCVFSRRDFGETTQLIKTAVDQDDEVFAKDLLPKKGKRSDIQHRGDVRMVRYIINSIIAPHLECVRAFGDRIVPMDGFDLRQSSCRNIIAVLAMQQSLPDPDSSQTRRDIVSDWDVPMPGVARANRFWNPNEKDRETIRIMNDRPETTKRDKAMGLVTSQIKTVTEMADDVDKRNKAASSSVLKHAAPKRVDPPAEDQQPTKAPRLAKVKVKRGARTVEVLPTERFWSGAFGIENHFIEAPLGAMS